MLTKLLLTLAVIVGAILFVRARSSRQPEDDIPRIKVVNPPPKEQRRRPWLVTASVLLLLGISGAGFYVYHHWRDGYREVTLTVIDSRTGKSSQYQAYKGEIEGREFTTVDGRRISLAETERLEIGR